MGITTGIQASGSSESHATPRLGAPRELTLCCSCPRYVCDPRPGSLRVRLCTPDAGVNGGRHHTHPESHEAESRPPAWTSGESLLPRLPCPLL